MGSVVDNLQRLDHVTSILCCVVHCRHTGRLFGASRFFHSVKHKVGKGEFVEALEGCLINIIVLEHGLSGGECTEGVDVVRGHLVRDRTLEFVVEHLANVKFVPSILHLLCSECLDAFSNTGVDTTAETSIT